MAAKSLQLSSLAHDNIPQASEQRASASPSTRQFMNSGSTGPRPLHLALGSVVATSSTPSSPSALSNIRISNDPGADSEAETSASPWNLTQQSSSSRGPSPLPASPTVTNTRKESTARKRSSITYLPPNLQSPTYLQTNRHEVSSPLSSSHTRTPFIVDGARSPGLARSSSLGGRGAKTPRSSTFERSSTGSILNSFDPNIANEMQHLKERSPVTLAEKHADLLHFIAQKESKCLELRSQLAVHEAELLQLKKKWEQIVNRGFERANGPNSASSIPSSYFSASASSPHLDASMSNSAAYFLALNSNNTNATGTVMLEGIKGGVQGVSRLIAAGLGSITQVNVSSADQSPRTPQTPDSASATVPLPLHLGSLSQRNRSSHGQKESQSSSSTVASHTTTSSSLSASTTSSATSASSTGTGGRSMSEDTATNLSNGHASTSEFETESDFGDFEDGKAHGSRTRSSTLTEHLMVEDTGATPMMSPNPRFQRRKLQNENNSTTASASRTGGASAGGSLLLSTQDLQLGSDVSNEDFDWGDGWDEPASEAQAADKYASNASDSKSRQDSKSTSMRTARAYEGEGALRSPLAPISSIPGLGAMGMGVSTPTTQQMSSWVGSVGKKWDEIKGSSTFTKSHKRASVLLSDIQESFISSLIAPSPISDTPISPITPASSAAFSSNALRNPLVFNAANAPVATQPTSGRREMSLLDDSDDESFGESGEDANTVRMALTPTRMSAPVLVPVAAPRKTVKAAKANEVAVNSSTDEDEWNW